jgi:hypothetical protein
MDAHLDNQALARLLKLRVMLAGHGSFRLEPDEESGLFRANCVLPGHGSIVTLWTSWAGREMARISRPGGRPLSVDLEITTPRHFVSILHNSDAEIWPGGSRPGARLPTEIVALVNRAVASGDPAVIQACDALYDSGSEASFPAEQGEWMPPEQAWAFIEACSDSDDRRVSEAAADLLAVVHRNRPGKPFSDAESLIMTSDWLECWLAARDRPTAERATSVA